MGPFRIQKQRNTQEIYNIYLMEYKFESPSTEKLSLSANVRQAGTNFLSHNSLLMRRKIMEQSKSGHWCEKQNAKYFAFLQKFKSKFNEKESRRQWKVFKALSKFVQSRNANQCRSHHHKMNKNFSSIEETLEFLSKKHPSIKAKASMYFQELQKIDIGAQQATFPDSFNRVEIQNFQQRNKEQDFIDYEKDQNRRFQQQMKLTDLAFIPTGTSYNYQQPLNAQLPNYGNPSIGAFGVFPSTGLMNSGNQEYQGPSYYYQGPCQGYYENQREEWQLKEEKERIKQQKWLECQELFIHYISKLNQAMSM